MTDKELLKCAAKAACIELIDFYWDEGLQGFWLHEGLTFWSPITDDGDALRLVVRLNLTVKVELHEVEVFDADGCLVSVALDKQEDHYAATRRAIVRAAAEIGRQA